MRGSTPIARAARLGRALAVLGALAFGLAPAAAAEDVYQRPSDFLTAVFGSQSPEPRLLWLNGAMRDRAARILGHSFPGVRVRYWERGARTAWILEEIGKYKPITTGFVIADGAIEQVKVLIYRESHGWEVRHAFFTDQFRDVRLRPDGGLTRGIDGISGATLSVDALTRLARLALLFHGYAKESP